MTLSAKAKTFELQQSRANSPLFAIRTSINARSYTRQIKIQTLRALEKMLQPVSQGNDHDRLKPRIQKIS